MQRRRIVFGMLSLTFLVLSLMACAGRVHRGQIQAVDVSPEAASDLIGSYVVNGVDPLGGEYSGVLLIEPGATPGSYRLRWTVTGSLQEGEGVLTGNVLRVEWRTVAGQRIRAQGTVTYTVTVAGELHGLRSLAGYPGQGRESAFPNR